MYETRIGFRILGGSGTLFAALFPTWASRNSSAFLPRCSPKQGGHSTKPCPSLTGASMVVTFRGLIPEIKHSTLTTIEPN